MGAKVTVACKLPNGLDLGDGYTDKDGAFHSFRQDGERVILKGSNASGSVAGHGITPNVDAELFAHWREVHKDADFVKRGFVFAHDKEAMTLGQAAERENVRTGLEGMNQDIVSDPRAPKPTNPSVKLEAGDKPK